MVEENPEKEIMLDPKWSILEDGLGYNVLVVGGVPGIDKDGREIVTFTCKPDEVVRKRYKFRIGVEIDPETNNMKIICLKQDLIPLNMYDDSNRKWLYVKTFRHEPTELSNRESNIKIELNRMAKRILLLEAENIRLNEQLELARTNPAKFIKQGAEVFQEAMKGITELTRKPGEKE